MESKRVSSSATSKVNCDPAKKKSGTNTIKATKKSSGDCDVSESTSHTQFFGKKRRFDDYKRITRDTYYGVSSESSDTFGCVHGSVGKLYTESQQLERTLLHELDPVPVGRAWTAACPPAYGWEMAPKLAFLVTDAAPLQQLDRLNAHLRDFATTSRAGYKIDYLDSVTIILDFLKTTYLKEPSLREGFVSLLENTRQPIILNRNADIATYFDNVTNYIGFIGILLMGLEEDALFGIVSEAVLWHLSAADARRPANALRRHGTLLAAAPALFHATVRMLAAATSCRFPTFLRIALLLAGASQENCIELLKGNILENIFYRFNPYFPERKLPAYDINPADPQDHNVQLGDSSVNLHTTLTLLLVLVKTLKECSDNNPKFHEQMPVPDSYAQRCFIWAFRYECRARGHKTQRTTLTVITTALIRCFGARLEMFSLCLMSDVMSLAIATEFPLQRGWVASVNFNTSQADVQFKKVLIYLSVEFIKTFPCNRFLIESQHWFVGLMYLLDPGLMQLRAKWSQPLYEELRVTSLQALVCALPMAHLELPTKCGLIRRIMWYVEWYSWSPYELGVLYWSLRLLLAVVGRHGTPARPLAIRDLFETHGVIILIHLLSTLIAQRGPPVEMCQVVIALSLRVLAGGLESAQTRVRCEVYPQIRWPNSINSLARTMLNLILESLSKSYIISERWLVSLLNFIWEGIIWKDEYRKHFIANNGVYQLLDLITLSKASVQCVALALVCDLACAGGAVSQLVSWRASAVASNVHPRVVKPGATIASLLASVFRDECRKIGVRLNEDGVMQDLDNPLRSPRVQKALENPNLDTAVYCKNPICYAAADLAGSRMSKAGWAAIWRLANADLVVGTGATLSLCLRFNSLGLKAFALLQMLSQDLNDKVMVADEAYNLYKNIQLAPEDEVILLLCSHFLTEKLMETWTEISMQSPTLEPRDANILEEFLHINKGWAAEIKRQQEEIVETDRKRKHDEECSLYSFLARVRLNMALDALREVRCAARTASRERLTHAMLADAVRALHQRRAAHTADLGEPVLRTYSPPLDDQNATAQYVKTYSIPREQAKDESPTLTLYSVY